jgi:hypothetical protein
VDQLLQTFEDRRAGLSDPDLSGTPKVERYFTSIYEGEADRLTNAIVESEPHLAPDEVARLREEIDRLVRTTVIPAYARLAGVFTPRERRDFFLIPRARILERIAWAAAGLLLGLIALRLPILPIWSREAVIPLVVAGFVYPELRRYLALKKYERELNRLVANTEREIARLDQAYSRSGAVIDELNELEKGS